jgi:hypothetical protein
MIGRVSDDFTTKFATTLQHMHDSFTDRNDDAEFRNKTEMIDQ